MAFFPDAHFLLGAHQSRQFPPDEGLEVAIAGRSNAGKSSAISAILGRQNLARSSKTPGRTQQINFFTLNATQRLVDLPGYGFAQVPLAVKAHWEKLLGDYFADRRSLAGVVIVMDARRPLTEIDAQMLELAATRALPMHILLTKADKLSRSEAQKTLIGVRKELGDRASVQIFSALTKVGVDDARAALLKLLKT